MDRPVVVPRKCGRRGIASMYSVSSRTVTRWIEHGLPYSQESPGAKVLISPADVEEFLRPKRKAQLDLNAMVQDVMTDLARSAKPTGASQARKQGAGTDIQCKP